MEITSEYLAELFAKGETLNVPTDHSAAQIEVSPRGKRKDQGSWSIIGKRFLVDNPAYCVSCELHQRGCKESKPQFTDVANLVLMLAVAKCAQIRNAVVAWE